MHMIDISRKVAAEREAIAEGVLTIKPSVIKLIKENKVPKGNVLEAAEIAGILGAKETHEIIPLCHPIPIEFVEIEFSLKNRKIKITTAVRTCAKTGVEMEALAACAVAAMTIYDMCKPLDKEIEISHIRLIKKTGGRSGTYIREAK